MFESMTHGSAWSAPAPVPAADALPEMNHLMRIVRRALRSGLGPQPLVRWVRETAAAYSADGVADGEPLTRCVAQDLGRALRTRSTRPCTTTPRSADTVLLGAGETWLQPAAV